MNKPKRDYTLSNSALKQRRAASARAVAERKPATDWRTIRVPAELAKEIEAARIAGGDSAAWQVIARAVLIL